MKTTLKQQVARIQRLSDKIEILEEIQQTEGLSTVKRDQLHVLYAEVHRLTDAVAAAQNRC